MDRLNKLLPLATKFERTAEDVEDDLLLSGGGMASSVSVSTGGVGLKVGDKRRSREFGTGSTARGSTGEISSMASKTQSTANYTTGSHDITIGTRDFVVPPEGINFDENDEDLYYSKEEFEAAEDGEEEDGMDLQKNALSGIDGEMNYDDDYWAHK